MTYINHFATAFSVLCQRTDTQKALYKRLKNRPQAGSISEQRVGLVFRKRVGG